MSSGLFRCCNTGVRSWSDEVLVLCLEECTGDSNDALATDLRSGVIEFAEIVSGDAWGSLFSDLNDVPFDAWFCFCSESFGKLRIVALSSPCTLFGTEGLRLECPDMDCCGALKMGSSNTPECDLLLLWEEDESMNGKPGISLA